NNNTSSKYYFFVTLTNFDDLILGQHVYTELDFGQTQKKEGIWLPSPYIMSDGGKSFVWVRDDKEKLIRRQITLGEMDKELDAYQVTEGLQLFDYIAFPQETLKNGMDTVVGDAAPPTNNGTMGGGAMDGAVPEENPAPDDSATKDQTAAAAPQTVN
ncbi:MAG: efflux RND transporter periplasmic adaptor subunit, partial [Oscillospiraceae bacterium]